MNLTYKKSLLLAIAAGMGLVPSTLWAVAPRSLDSGPVYIPAELKEQTVSLGAWYSIAAGATVMDGLDLNVKIPTKLGYPVRNASGNSLRVTVSLTNGATFVKKPTLVCSHQAGTTAISLSSGASAGAYSAYSWSTAAALTSFTAATAGAYIIDSTPGTQTTAGLNSYSFTFPDNFNVVNADSGSCLLSLSAGAPADSATSGTTVSAVIGGVKLDASTVSLNATIISKDVVLTSAVHTIPLVSFVTAYKLTVNPLQTFDGAHTAIATVDVGKQSKQFEQGAVAYAGGVKLSLASGVTNLRGLGGNALTATDVISTATLVFSGPPIRTLSNVTLVASGVCAGGTSIGTKLASTTAADTISIKLKQSELVSNSATFVVCLNAPSATTSSPMEIGQVSVAGTMETSTGAVDLESKDLVKVTRNGTVIRVLNIPRGDAVDPFRINIRMYNASNQKIANITGSLIGLDGKVIKDVVLLAELAPYNVMRVTSADLLKLVGTPWTGRPWLIIQAPASSESFKVQALMVNPNGVVSNISTDAPN